MQHAGIHCLNLILTNQFGFQHQPQPPFILCCNFKAFFTTFKRTMCFLVILNKILLKELTIVLFSHFHEYLVSPEPPCPGMCNGDNACGVAACPDE